MPDMAGAAPLGVHVLRSGAGLPLVLLPGFPLDHRLWSDVAALLPEGRTVLAVDPPGLGDSPPPEAVETALGAGPDPSLDTAADAVAATLRARGIARAVVAGLSMGGYTALALVERHPDLVAGLALVDTRSTPDDDAGRAKRRAVAEAVLAAGDLAALDGTARGLLAPVHHERLVDRVTGWIEQQSPAGVAWSQRAMAARPDRTDVLRAVRVPVLVVVGEADSITPVAAAQHMADARPGTDLVVVPGAGHLTSVEDPGAVAAALGRLLERVDPTTV